eukprot:s558_g37.t1
MVITFVCLGCLQLVWTYFRRAVSSQGLSNNPPVLNAAVMRAARCLILLALLPWNIRAHASLRGRLSRSPCHCQIDNKHWRKASRTQPKCLFIDLGAGAGSDLEAFAQDKFGPVKNCPSGGDWEAILVEANPVFAPTLNAVAAKFPGKVHVNASHAAYMCDAKTAFYVNPAETNSLAGFQQAAATSLRTELQKLEVETVNINRLLIENAIPGDYVILKMDVEGAEFDILPCMAESPGSLVDRLYVEEHDPSWGLEGATLSSMQTAKAGLRTPSAGHPWISKMYHSRICLTKQDLVQLRRSLSTHHSKDQSLIHRISRAIMTDSDPWRCRYCMKISNASANGCSECLISWQDCQDHSFVPPRRQQKTSQGWDWTYAQESEKSPRTPKGTKIDKSWQTPKSPRKGNGKGKGHGQQKGRGKAQKGQFQDKGKEKGKEQGHVPQSGKGNLRLPAATTAIPPEPPWTPSLSTTTQLAPLPPPTSAPPLSEEELAFKELITALKKSPKELDPEVQAIVQRTTLKEGQNAGQSLSTAVDDMRTAREALDCARLARHNLHIKWRNFLADAVKRWQKHMEDFQREDKDLTEQIELARTALSQAMQLFETSKSDIGEGVVDVEAEDAMNEEAKDKDSINTALIQSMSTMTTQLVELQASAEAMVVEGEKKAKRPRTSEGSSEAIGGMPSPSAPALQAFANREKPFVSPDKM